MNLIEWKDRYIGHLEKSTKGQNTIKNYRHDIDAFIKYLETKQAVDHFNDFNTTKVMEYYTYLEHNFSSTNTRRRRIQSLRLFFDFLVSQGIFPENLVKKAPSSPKFVDIPRPTPFTDVLKLHKGLKEKIANSQTTLDKIKNKRNLILFYLIYETGLKVSEIAKLNASDLFPGTKEWRVLIQPEKRDAYSVPGPIQLWPVFENYLFELKFAQGEFSIQFSELLFNANPHRLLNGGLSPRGIEMMFKDWERDFKVSTTAKNLRQAAIFKWMNLYKPENSIKDWMGVTPAYSLAPYYQVWQESPSDFLYMELVP